MGTFSVQFRVSSLNKAGKFVDMEGIVDTGAALPLIPAKILRSLGIKPTHEKTFVLADGSRIRLGIGEGRLAYAKKDAPCLVAFAPPSTEPLFGALALESLGLEVDSVNRRLKATKLYLVAATGREAR